jgi:hypothetical protein
MNRLTTRSISDTANATTGHALPRDALNLLAAILGKLGILRDDADYHLLRAAMVIIFFFFGYQKWWAYEAERLIPYISNGPLIFWLYPAFGMRGATWFLGVSEWIFGTLLFLGFLEQEARHSWRARILRHFHRHCNDHSVHARRLGRCCRRVSGDGRQCAVPDEGHRAARGLCLPA